MVHRRLAVGAKRCAGKQALSSSSGGCALHQPTTRNRMSSEANIVVTHSHGVTHRPTIEQFIGRKHGCGSILVQFTKFELQRTYDIETKTKTWQFLCLHSISPTNFNEPRIQSTLPSLSSSNNPSVPFLLMSPQKEKPSS